MSAVLVVGCGRSDALQYDWDDRRVLCSMSIDDRTGASWERIEEQLALARDHGSVAVVHAHVPGETISLEQIDRVLERARREAIETVTFAELSPAGPPRAGLALCFDDHSIGAWYRIRHRLAAHGARVTFFVTRYHERTDEERAQLAELAAAGHDIESHSVSHLEPIPYAAEHGVAGYVADEVLPSIQVLRDAGYPVTSFAFPYGSSTRDLEAAVLEHVDLVRVGAGSCPW
ncbi:MAG TPA: polysaccharide deacetylase family protein [Kofleriaceae bacterium]|nr:polysaccharide deacetylase family protein [Kofleriaceae bacterium]